MAFKDPEKQRKYRKDWYERKLISDPSYAGKIREWHRNRYKTDTEFREASLKRSEIRRLVYASTAKALISEFRKDGCFGCGEKDFEVLCAHHRDPKQKKFNINKVTGGRYSKNTIILELKKCDCLCLNCHAKLHARLRREQNGR
jgi:hypothetical protein